MSMCTLCYYIIGTKGETQAAFKSEAALFHRKPGRILIKKIQKKAILPTLSVIIPKVLCYYSSVESTACDPG